MKLRGILEVGIRGPFGREETEKNRVVSGKKKRCLNGTPIKTDEKKEKKREKKS